jgi:hypothetical protein
MGFLSCASAATEIVAAAATQASNVPILLDRVCIQLLPYWPEIAGGLFFVP